MLVYLKEFRALPVLALALNLSVLSVLGRSPAPPALIMPVAVSPGLYRVVTIIFTANLLGDASNPPIRTLQLALRAQLKATHRLGAWFYAGQRRYCDVGRARRGHDQESFSSTPVDIVVGEEFVALRDHGCLGFGDIRKPAYVMLAPIVLNFGHPAVAVPIDTCNTTSVVGG